MNQIILYDGDCGLCNKSVAWLLKHDKKRHFRFASLTSNFAREHIGINIEKLNFDSVILIDNGIKYFYSEAVFRILKIIGGRYSLLRIFKIIPVSISDFLYKLIAKYRDKLFKSHKCSLIDRNHSELFFD